MANAQDALASVYAKSLFELAESAGSRAKIEEVNDELEQLVELIRADRRFREMLGSPIVDRVKRGQALRSIFNGRVSDLTLRFLLVLNRKGRLGRLEDIADAYTHLMQVAFERVEVDVFTAGPLAEDALASIRARIQTALGREPVLHTYTDPHMIGGVKLRIGDRLIDGSVASKLRRIKDNLLNRGGWAVRDHYDRIVSED